MPATESAQGQKWTRTFDLRRETEDKKSPPRFREWVKNPVEVLPKGATGTFQKTKKDGKTENYLLWSGWSGTLIDLRVEDIGYGDAKPEKTLIAVLDDEADVVEIHLPFFKTYARDFMKRILGPNFNPKSSLSMSPYAMDGRDGGAQNVGISCYSGANKLTAVVSAYNGGTPDAHLANMPRVEKVMVGGDEVSDHGPQCAWLWAQVQSNVVPTLLKFGEAVQRTPLPTPSAAPQQQRGGIGPIAVTNSAEPHVTNNAATSAGFEGLNAPPPADLDPLPF